VSAKNAYNMFLTLSW